VRKLHLLGLLPGVKIMLLLLKHEFSYLSLISSSFYQSIENPETGTKIKAKVYLSHTIHPYALVGIHGLNTGSYERGNIKFTYMTKTGINTNLLAPFRIVEYEARAAQCDFKVRITKEVK